MTLNLHPDDYLLFARVCIIGREVAEHFGLRLNSIQPFPADRMTREYEHGVYGRCYTSTGDIHIGIRYQSKGAWLGRLPEYEIYETLAHELAHLRVPRHDKTFWDFYREVKAVVEKRRFQ